jgi:monoterpene epsilon-lactone hydrolase
MSNRERVAVAKMVFDYAARNVSARVRRGIRGARRPRWTVQVETMVDLLRANIDRLRGRSVNELRAVATGSLLPSNAMKAVRVEPCDAGGVPAEWVSPLEGETSRHFLYLHGGGYIVGSPRSHRDLLARIALKSRARVLGVDYRLAPEHPFPAAIEDAVSAYRFLLDSGVDPKRVIVGGDSAGGGLAVATLLTLRDARLPLPAGAVLLSPWLDLEGAGQSVVSNAPFDWIDEDYMRRCARDYLGAVSPREPRASPVHADLAQLPPMLLQVGGAEILLDDARSFAARAHEAGVELTLEVWDDMFHAFHLFAALVPEGRRAIRAIAAFVEQRVPELR